MSYLILMDIYIYIEITLHTPHLSWQRAMRATPMLPRMATGQLLYDAPCPKVAAMHVLVLS